MIEERGTSHFEYPEGNSGPDRASQGNILLVGPFSGQFAPRSRDDLQRELQERQVDSVADLCKAFDIRMDGTYVGVDGEPVHVSLPVTDETTFTPDELTKKEPTLLRTYVRARCYEQLAEYLGEHDRDCLIEEEIAHLEAQAKMLEASLEGGQP